MTNLQETRAFATRQVRPDEEALEGALSWGSDLEANEALFSGLSHHFRELSIYVQVMYLRLLAAMDEEALEVYPEWHPGREINEASFSSLSYYFQYLSIYVQVMYLRLLAAMASFHQGLEVQASGSSYVAHFHSTRIPYYTHHFQCHTSHKFFYIPGSFFINSKVYLHKFISYTIQCYSLLLMKFSNDEHFVAPLCLACS